METFYLLIVLFLFVLAIFDLVVGVSNDAVNFLNSAIGSKAASFRVIMIISAMGILIGASLSNGMMDVARHGIYQPQYFYFSEIMCILVAVMLTDVVLLDIFNSLGMPTSTTVSLVFELLGGTVALALIKTINSDGALLFGDLLNSDKALTVILAIFVSVAIAFFFGALVQYLSRMLFSFNYKPRMKYFVAVFGGIAATSIIYFMLIKGLKDTTFMSGNVKEWIHGHTSDIVWGCFILSTVLMQVLHWLKVNVFKVIVLLGTFALALAFAGNDLVNFIGVPLAGYSSYLDFVAQGIMVVALFTSKKAQNVVKTSLDLSRQSEGDESFGTSPVARVLVRTCSNVSTTLTSVVPLPVKVWVDKRFNQDDVILEQGAAFDLIRAAVNLVLAGLLVALGTSLKLPLSTTYVTFMVAMGTSLADRAWGRESAVYRITGVLSVIGGWFITAGAAFTICFVVATVIYFGGTAAILAFLALAIYSLVRSHLKFRKKSNKETVSPTIKQLMDTNDSSVALVLFRQHTRDELESVLTFASESFDKSVNGFMNENLRDLRKVLGAIEEEKLHLKQVKRIGTLGVTQLDRAIAVEKGLYYYQGNDFASEIVFSLRRLSEPCKDHIDNNFTPLSDVQKEEFGKMSEDIMSYLMKCSNEIRLNEYTNFEQLVETAVTLTTRLTLLKKGELKRIQGQTGSTKVSMVYLNMVQETQNVVSFTSNLIKVSRKFQME